MAVTRTERGYPGHLIVSRWCVYHRNTLVSDGWQRIVVSSIGHYIPRDSDGEPETIGVSQYYETMAFRVRDADPYVEADTSDQVSLECETYITDIEFDADFRADAMHEAAVEEITARIERGEFR